MGKKHNESIERQDFNAYRQLVGHLALLLVQFVQNKHAVEAFQIVKHHENLSLALAVWDVSEIIQVAQKL